MFEYLYEWLQNISYYLILVTAVTYVLPSNSYRKYIRFFTGLVLIIMLLNPILNLFGMKAPYIYEYKNEKQRFIENMGNEMNHNKKVQIEVEDIVIGP